MSIAKTKPSIFPEDKAVQALKGMITNINALKKCQKRLLERFPTSEYAKYTDGYNAACQDILHTIDRMIYDLENN